MKELGWADFWSFLENLKIKINTDMVTASILSLPNKGIRFVKYLTATRVRILLVLVWVCVQSIIKRLRQFSLGFYKIHKCYHWKINIIYIYMLYILRMNIKENSSNNHKSTFRIKNFFLRKKITKALQTFPRWFLYWEKYQETFMTQKMILAPRFDQLD